MNVLNNVGNALLRIDFVKKELTKTHAFIDQHQLPVAKVEDDLDAQMMALEKWSGTPIFTDGVRQAKVWQQVSLALSIVTGLLFGGIFVANKFMPEKEIFTNLMDWLFHHMLLGCGILLALFLVILIAVLQRKRLEQQLYGGKLYYETWKNIQQKIA